MKHLFLFFCILFIISIGNGQNWISLGPDDFNTPSSGDGIYYTKIISDKNNHHVIAYFQKSIVKVKKWKNNFWEDLKLDDSVSIYDGNYIALDSSSNVYIAYTEKTYCPKSYVKKFINGNWTIIGSTAFTDDNEFAEEISIAIGFDQNPLVLYSTANKLKLKKWNGAKWIPLDSNIAHANVSTTKIALDTLGNPIVIYSDLKNNDRFTIKKWNGNLWSLINTESLNNESTRDVNIQIDKYNNPIISYIDWKSKGIKTYKYIANKWEKIGDISTSLGLSFSHDMKLNLKGEPVILFNDYKISKTKVLYWTGSVWTIAGINDIAMSSTSYGSLDFTNDGNPVIAYCDHFYQYSAKVSHLINNNWKQIGDIGIAENSIVNFEFAVNNIDEPYILYVEGKYGSRLKIKKWTGSIWSIDGFNLSEERPSSFKMSLTKAGLPLIAYYNMNNKKLLFKKKTKEGWQNIINDGLNIDLSNSLILKTDSNDNPIISYEQPNHVTKITKWDGERWVDLKSDSISSRRASLLSLTTDERDSVFIAYYDDDTKKLCIKKFIGNTWKPIEENGLGLRTYEYPVSLQIAINNTHKLTVAYSSHLSGLVVKQLIDKRWITIGDSVYDGLASFMKIALDNKGQPSVIFRGSEKNNGKSIVKMYRNGRWLGKENEIISSDESLYNQIIQSPNGYLYAAYFGSNYNVFVKRNYDECYPIILSQPDSRIICLGEEIILSASTAGRNLKYNWNTNDTSSSLNINRGGIYYVTISGGCNTIVSNFITITGIQVLRTKIVSQSPNETVCDGQSYLFSCTTNGSNIKYKWNTGETTSFIIKSISGTYMTTISGECGDVVSQPFNLVVKPKTKVQFESYIYTICGGTQIFISPTVIGEKLNYKWSSGQNSNTITVSSIGNYQLSISGICGSIVSDTIKVLQNIFDVPSIVKQPQNETICGGNFATFSISVVGVGISYKWNTGDTTSMISTSNEGRYICTVTGRCGLQKSEEVTLSFISDENGYHTICGVLNNYENTFEGESSLYPNPNNGSFAINSNEGDIINIYNSNGKLISSNLYTKDPLYFRLFSEGLYLVSIQKKSKNILYKIIVE